MSTRHGSRARSRRALATLAVLGSAAGTVVISAGAASAAPPVFNDPPTRVYTGAGQDLVFAGDDPITGESRAIDVTIEGDDSTCSVLSPGGEGHDGTCAYAQIQILEPNRGGLTIDDSAIAYIGPNRSGDIVYNIGGPIADVQAALASLTYVPPDDDFETTDQATVTARLSIQDATAPAPQTANIDIDIRVEGDNDWPELTAPADAPFSVEAGQTFSVLESAGTDVFRVTDDDADQGEIDDYLLGVAWVDCGLVSFPTLSTYATYIGDPATILADAGFDPTLIPGEVANGLTISSDTDEVTAVAWLAQIDEDNSDDSDSFNSAIRWIDFHAPAQAASCTLTMVVSDLGNNGMPLPEELPNPGIDVVQIVFEVAAETPSSTDPPASTEPTDTTEPPASTEPTDTTEPVETTEPAETTEPTDTTEPTETTEPADTTDPTDTTEPADTTDPTDTTEPPVDSTEPPVDTDAATTTTTTTTSTTEVPVDTAVSATTTTVAGEPGGTTPVPAGSVSADVVTPSLERGQQQTGHGYGFVPGEIVTGVQQSTPFELGTAIADINGVATFTWTIRDDESVGPHTFTVTGPSGTASATFEVAAPAAPNGPTVPTGGPGSVEDPLPDTGTAALPIVVLATLLVILGGAAISLRRTPR